MPTIRDPADRSKLIERLMKLRSDETPSWGKMNASQMMSHLVQTGGHAISGNPCGQKQFFNENVVKAADTVCFADAEGRENLTRNESARKWAKASRYVSH